MSLRGDVFCILLLLLFFTSSSSPAEELTLYSGPFELTTSSATKGRGRVVISSISPTLHSLNLNLDGLVYRSTSTEMLEYPGLRLRTSEGHCFLRKISIKDETGKLEIKEEGDFKEFPVASGSAAAGGGSCRFEWRGEMVPVSVINMKVRVFVFVALVLTVFQFRWTVGLVESLEETGRAGRICEWWVFVLKAGTLVESILLLFLGLIGQSMFSVFGMVAFLKFLLFSVLESRVLIQVARARQSEAEWEQFRAHLRKMYMKFNFVVMSSIFLCIFFANRIDLILICAQFYWMPQIVSDAVSGVKNSLPLGYVAMSAISRLWFPLFVANFGVFEKISFLDGDIYPRSSVGSQVGFVMLGVQGFQVGVIFLQRKLGPRFFLPSFFLPSVYNYYRPVSTRYGGGDIELAGVQSQIECVICMNDIQNQKPAVTPCGHCFHGDCLAEWIDIKMECPTCRTPLPPMC